MITRQIGKILRGKATPFQLVAACVLGALLGFAPPSLVQAPALYALLVAALLVTNANLGLSLLVFGIMRLVSLLAVPVSFQIGRALLDGPTSGLFEVLANAPVLAWCGLQYYAVAGGLVLGALFGLGLGLLIAGTVRRFRTRMAASAKAAAAGDPSRLQKLTAKPGARFLVWLLFGGAGKLTWEQKLEQKRVGNPVRTWGAALIVVGLAGAWIAHEKLAGPLARKGIGSGLESVNRATVDVGPVELDLRTARLAIRDLALTDPNDLARDLFRAAALEVDVDQADFLRRRFHLAKVVIGEASSGAQRATPGERVGPPFEETIEEAGSALPDLKDLKLEDVIAEYEVWKGRLAQARSWLDRLSGSPADPDAEETYRERLERAVRDQGWMTVEAGHLIDEAPTFRLTDLQVDGLDLAWLPGRVFDLRARELSTHPHLLDEAPRIELASRDGSIAFTVDLGPVSRAGGNGALKVVWKGLAVDEVMGKLKLPGGAPLAGGTLDLELDGGWAEGRIGHVDLPLRVTLHDTTLTLKGQKPTKLDHLVLPIGIRGPIDAPRIRFESDALVDALVDAGKRELAGKLRDGLGEKLGEKLPDGLGEKVDEKLGKEAGKALEGLLGGKKKDG